MIAQAKGLGVVVTAGGAFDHNPFSDEAKVKIDTKFAGIDKEYALAKFFARASGVAAAATDTGITIAQTGKPAVVAGFDNFNFGLLTGINAKANLEVGIQRALAFFTDPYVEGALGDLKVDIKAMDRKLQSTVFNVTIDKNAGDTAQIRDGRIVLSPAALTSADAVFLNIVHELLHKVVAPDADELNIVALEAVLQTVTGTKLDYYNRVYTGAGFLGIEGTPFKSFTDSATGVDMDYLGFMRLIFNEMPEYLKPLITGSDVNNLGTNLLAGKTVTDDKDAVIKVDGLAGSYLVAAKSA